MNCAPQPLGIPPRQRGAVLAIVLVMMLVVLSLGVFAMKGATMQERQVSNMRDRANAMQAAESALRYAFQIVRTKTNEAGEHPDILDCADLNARKTNDCSSIPNNVFTGTDATWHNAPELNGYIPQYRIQRLGHAATNEYAVTIVENTVINSNFENGYGTTDTTGTSGQDRYIYRILARSYAPSVNNNDSALVVLSALAR